MFNAFVARFGSALKPQLVTVAGCDIQMFNLDLTGATAPQSGTRFPVWNNTWVDANNDSTPNYIHNTHRLRDVALLDGFPYGMASYSTEGWSLFKINTDGTGTVTGFYVRRPLQAARLAGQRVVRSTAPRSGMGLDGHAYIVGRYLDKSSRRLQDLRHGHGSAAPTLAVKSTLPSPGLS